MDYRLPERDRMIVIGVDCHEGCGHAEPRYERSSS